MRIFQPSVRAGSGGGRARGRFWPRKARRQTPSRPQGGGQEAARQEETRQALRPARQGAVRRGQDAGPHGGARDRLLRQGLPRRRRRAAHRRRRPGRPCASRATATGAIPSSSRWSRSSALEAKAHDGWPGLLVGDLSQPRGGPMLTGHASHQVGLDADIWLTPMPDRRLTEQEREDLSATSMLAADKVSVDPNDLDGRARAPHQARRLLRRRSSASSCTRPSRRRCATPPPRTRITAWLRKVRAYWGHYYHFHVRIACPAGSGNCEAQPPLPPTTAAAPSSSTGWRWSSEARSPSRQCPPPPASPSRPSPASRSISCPPNAARC